MSTIEAGKKALLALGLLDQAKELDLRSRTRTSSTLSGDRVGGLGTSYI